MKEFDELSLQKGQVNDGKIISLFGAPGFYKSVYYIDCFSLWLMTILTAPMVTIFTALSLVVVSSCYAALYESASSLPGLKYDFVIIGGE